MVVTGGLMWMSRSHSHSIIRGSSSRRLDELYAEVGAFHQQLSVQRRHIDRHPPRGDGAGRGDERKEKKKRGRGER
jgi:hypothetical protein